MGKKVITVARQFGSMGRPIAIELAEKLGFEYYDRDIIEKAAMDMGVPVYELQEIDDHKAPGYKKMMFPLGIGGGAKQDRLFGIEREIILKLAKEQDCVIVGRCADFILTEAGHAGLFNIFIYATYQQRFQFSLNNLGLTNEAIEKTIRRVDEGRANYYTHYTGERFDSPKYRDLMINSASMDLGKVSGAIAHCAKMRFGL
ncbi:MAG: cytidylate kinase-like family protein [Clostridiales Family XIII bacterium]|jgi:cytidylate kinase|nr:cytidylate kinase-like family protein [Clostridiales Family XIII bacterium]